MKKFKPLLTAICLTLLFTTNIKAQDDDVNAGWYADGVKVDKIDCYNFKKLQLVVPYNSEWSTYDFISIHVSYMVGLMPGEDGVKLISTKSINGFIKGKYLVYSLFKSNEGPGSSQNGNDVLDLIQGDPYSAKGIPNQTDYFIGAKESPRLLRLFRWDLKYEDGKAKNKDKPASDLVLSFDVYGLTQTGIKEEYNQSCSCIKKKPVYSSAKGSQTYKLTCTNRLINKAAVENLVFSETCNYQGKKLDFNSLGGANSNNNGSGNVTINNTVVVKNEVHSTTKTTGGNTSSGSASGKTIITTGVVKTQAQLKPLDKTKPGYFEEKDGGKITRAGYKKGDDYLGEVREYNTDGTVSEVNVYSDGVQDGLFLRFDGDGKLETSGYYKKGNNDGTWQWFSNGVLSKTTKYVDGQEQ